MPHAVVARNLESVKDQAVRSFETLLSSMVALAQSPDVSVKDLEEGFSVGILGAAQRGFAMILSTACKAEMERDLAERGLTPDDIEIRSDTGGYLTLTTTLGSVMFPCFSYWEKTCGARVLRAPARARLLKHHQNCRSSPLCLEWEAALASQHPFRSAEQALAFFSRGAVTLEDNTIADHAVTIGELIEPEWFYKKPKDIRTILLTKATRHRKTQQPILYFSTDGHVLRQYTDASWAWDWKVSNGIRIWCEDAKTGKIIHLGGEYCWGGIDAIARRVSQLVDAGILPNDSAEWAAVDAFTALITDGSEPIVSKIYPLLPMAEPILDPFHLLGWFAEFAAVAYPGKKGKRARSAIYDQAWRVVLGGRPSRKASKASARSKLRRAPRTRNRPLHAHDISPALEPKKRRKPDGTAKALLDLIPLNLRRSATALAAQDTLRQRIEKNVLRMDYEGYLAHGLQIGSGPMESFHRTGSQLRLKVPGAKWTEASSNGILALRMLQLSGRWDEFWHRPDLDSMLAAGFAQRSTVRAAHRREAAKARAAAAEAARERTPAVAPAAA